MSNITRAVALIALGLTGAGTLAVGAGAAYVMVGAPVTVDVKVHRMGKNLGVDSRFVDSQMAAANDVYAPHGIQFSHTQVSESIPDERAWRRDPPEQAFESLVDLDTMLAPDGIDIYVVRDMNRFDGGAVFRCAMGDGRGAVSVSVLKPNGDRQPSRKWAHELGHALGLIHTPCEKQYADNLMMSGGCKYAKSDRVELTSKQVAIALDQARRNRPIACREAKGVIR